MGVRAWLLINTVCMGVILLLSSKYLPVLHYLPPLHGNAAVHYLFVPVLGFPEHDVVVDDEDAPVFVSIAMLVCYVAVGVCVRSLRYGYLQLNFSTRYARTQLNPVRNEMLGCALCWSSYVHICKLNSKLVCSISER